MNFNNFTIKSQEAIQEAVNLVKSRGQQAIEPVHIMPVSYTHLTLPTIA